MGVEWGICIFMCYDDDGKCGIDNHKLPDGADGDMRVNDMGLLQLCLTDGFGECVYFL